MPARTPLLKRRQFADRNILLPFFATLNGDYDAEEIRPAQDCG